MVLYEPVSGSADAASVFFEMANSNSIEYRCSGGSLLKIKQDRNIKNCTGGIVWETAFLLGTFLEVLSSRPRYEGGEMLHESL